MSEEWLDPRRQGGIGPVAGIEPPMHGRPRSKRGVEVVAKRGGERHLIASFDLHGIEDRRDNTTRFLLIGRAAPPASGCDLTCAVFTVRKDESGALYKLLEPFAQERVNLTAIQARPIKGKPWEYLFYLDFLGRADSPAARNALSHLREQADFLRILGCYPQGA